MRRRPPLLRSPLAHPSGRRPLLQVGERPGVRAAGAAMRGQRCEGSDAGAAMRGERCGGSDAGGAMRGERGEGEGRCAPRYPAHMDALPRTRLTSAFERRVARALDRQLADGQPLLVACSGGPDSSAALVAVARVRDGRGEVTAAVFDHRLRPADEVAADIAAVEALAQHLGVRFATGRAAPRPAGSEAAAREARYRWLAAACRAAGASWCVTGHTMDDQAETVLLRLARGTGVGGAAGMAVAGGWPVPGRGRLAGLLRPLLGVQRTEVEAYLAALGLEARSDPTNATPIYARNRVRQSVVPGLRTVNPRAVEAIARFAALARRDDEALTAIARAALPGLLRQEGAAVWLDRRAMRALPAAVGSRVLVAAAAVVGLALDAAQCDAVLGGLRRAGTRVALGGGEARVGASDVWVGRAVDGVEGRT